MMLKHDGTTHRYEVSLKGAGCCGLVPAMLVPSLTWRLRQLLHTMEFSSKRMKMSVLVRTPEGQVILYCKVREQRSCCYNCRRCYQEHT